MQAILLDRDGVINEERADYIKTWHEFRFLPGALDALQRLTRLEIPVLVITNQSAIGRGIIEQATVEEIHRKLMREVESVGGRIDAFFVCPHHPAAGCLCRKPKPGLLLQAAQQFGFALEESLFIGDSITDFEAAHAAGCRSILVKSGRQGASLDKFFIDAMLPPTLPPPIVADLGTAVDLIFAAYRE
jgi:D-glycero-D-manno-heptose 1,7-bisphosphate phosphatase